MYCMNCGAEITNTSARFCYQCGKEIIHNQSRIDLNDREPMQEKATNEELAELEDFEYCKEEIKKEQPTYRLQITKAEHRRIINISKDRINKYIPTLKQTLYSSPNGKYWVFIKVGQLRDSEAFTIMHSPYSDLNGEEYLGYCVDLYAVDTKKSISDRLLLLVEKDDYGIHFITADAIDRIKQTSILFVFASILTVMCIVVTIGVLFTSWGESLHVALFMLVSFILLGIASNLPFKKGRPI